MNTLQAARRYRDLEFASFYSLCRVLIDSNKYFYAQSLIPVLAQSLNISDETAFKILDHCLQAEKLDTSILFTENLDGLDEVLCSTEIQQDEEISGSLAISQSALVEVSSQVFQDLLGDYNVWNQLTELLSEGGQREDFETLKLDLIEAAAKLRQQAARQ
ncbi:hypothetical protein SS50377_23300 [Spironucleus salmonicida]|uniref:Uncharacterized protein n=1 Tax=Spironucleus salmonicida TaxID=348837 RepID=V6M1V5_9EUKA|nr:hypothetical protein SS50377_23300 [Spironucleus salmonicida]|eukprot:EST47169.1 Hypothetical protein SS50377_12680 [Spironucleus salmonicida]